MEQFVLSRRGEARLQAMLRWWDQNKNKQPIPQRRRAVSGTSRGTSEAVDVKIFEAQSILKKLDFTNGGPYEVKTGDTIIGETSAATAVISRVIITSGAWTAENVAGYFIMGNQAGTFEEENLKVGTESDVATIAGDSAATSYGAYYCYEQTLKADEWEDTDGDDKLDDKDTIGVEVLNLLETDSVADYTPMLGLYDRITAWKMTDDEGNKRWVGMPLVNSVRQVRATEEAGDFDHITSNLLLNNGVEAAESELGYHIEVYARICYGAALSAAEPRIANSQWLTAHNEQGKWWFDTVFNTTINHGA